MMHISSTRNHDHAGPAESIRSALRRGTRRDGARRERFEASKGVTQRSEKERNCAVGESQKSWLENPSAKNTEAGNLSDAGLAP